MKIKNGDEVLVLQGKDKGKKGKVEKIFARAGLVLVAGVNIYKKNVKKKERVAGGIVDITKPLPASKLAIVCPKCNLATRVVTAVVENKKVRICKKCQQSL